MTPAAPSGKYAMNRRRLTSSPLWLENLLRTVGYGAIGAFHGVHWRPDRLIVLGHMRSGSSLFSQLLSEHPDIAGYGETHLPYRRSLDFVPLQGKIAWVRRSLWPTERYALDKVLHDWLLEPDAAHVLDSERVHVAFLLRAPEPTLASLIASFGLGPSEAAEYYVQRLTTMREFAEHLTTRRQCVAIRYQHLVHRTPEVFDLVEAWLDLEVPLSESYRPLSRGNDPSGNLLTGQVLHGDKPVHHLADVDPAVLARCDSAFEHTWTYIAEHSSTVGSC